MRYRSYLKKIHSRLQALSESHDWFNNNQHGFRKGKSTETAASALIGIVKSGFKNKKVVSCAFLDINSAFDAAWHPAILNGLIDKSCPLYLIDIVQVF